MSGKWSLIGAAANGTEIVLSFAGNGGSVFHKAVRIPDGELRPRYGAPGQSLVEKERALIESHYAPCTRSYPEAESEGPQTY